MGLQLTLNVIRQGQAAAQQSFDSDVNRTVKIGRLKSAQVRLEDEAAARIHAVIELGAEGAQLVDMGSALGTVVNGIRCHKTALNHGDTIQVGETSILVGLGGAAMAAVAPVGGASAGAGPVSLPMDGHLVQPSGVAANQLGQAAGAMLVAPEVIDDPNRDTNKRPTTDLAFAAAVQSKPHPLLPPEPEMTTRNRVLEMRAYWGEVLLKVQHYKNPKCITLGEVKDTDFFISSEGLPEEVFPLVREIGGEHFLTFTRKMEGEIEVGGTSQPLEAWRGAPEVERDPKLEDSYRLRLDSNTRALIHWGGASFALRFVPPPRLLTADWHRALDLPYINTFVFSLLAHVTALAILMLYPSNTEDLGFDLFNEDAQSRFAVIIMEEPEEKESNKAILEKLQKKIKPPATSDGLKRPKPNPSNQNRAPAKSREQKAAEVKSRFQKMFSGGGGGGGLGGGGGSLSGALSGVIATRGAGSASGGLMGVGIRGKGPITGGLGGTRGLGAGIGTLGRAGGGGLGYGSGVGVGKKRVRDMISLSTPVIRGALPKEVIKRVINQHKAQIRYCYEVELQRNQKLEGRIKMRWVIAASGKVSTVSVAESTMGAPAVERCIASKIKTWKFPEPSGGGIVEVNYPFVFSAG